MSQRGSRRKTLSSTELENFLVDLSCSEAPPGGGGKGLTVSETRPLAEHAPNGSNARPKSQQLQQAPVAPPAPSAAEADEDHVRRYIRISKNPGSAFHEMCTLSRLVLSRTNYQMLPSRSLFPEQFPLPASSIEAKRAILHSLAPMLSDAEHQRQRDVQACEGSTRCRVGKGVGRYSSYEYTDLDTKKVVPVAEYERRYLEFIRQSKRTHAHDSTTYTVVPNPAATHALPPPPPAHTLAASVHGSAAAAAAVVVEQCEYESSDEEPQDSALVGLKAVSQMRARETEAANGSSSGRGSSSSSSSSSSSGSSPSRRHRPKATDGRAARRKTMSPGSVRAMLEEGLGLSGETGAAAEEAEADCSVCSAEGAGAGSEEEDAEVARAMGEMDAILAGEGAEGAFSRGGSGGMSINIGSGSSSGAGRAVVDGPAGDGEWEEKSYSPTAPPCDEQPDDTESKEQEGGAEGSVALTLCASPACGASASTASAALLPSPLLSFSPLVPPSEAEAQARRGARSQARMSLDADFMDLVMAAGGGALLAESEGPAESSDADAIASACVSLAHNEETSTPALPALEAEAETEDSPPSLEAFRQAAEARASVRLEVLRWRFAWEMASFHAAAEGRRRALVSR